MKTILSEDTLFIWMTAMPIAKRVTAPFLTTDIQFLENTLRYDILAANHFARQVRILYTYITNIDSLIPR